MIEEKTLGAEDTNLNELRKLRDELTSQRDNLKSEVATLKTKQEESSQVLAGMEKCINQWFYCLGCLRFKEGKWQPGGKDQHDHPGLAIEDK